MRALAIEHRAAVKFYLIARIAQLERINCVIQFLYGVKYRPLEHGKTCQNEMLFARVFDRTRTIDIEDEHSALVGVNWWGTKKEAAG